jgi:hypothetical protein
VVVCGGEWCGWSGLSWCVCFWLISCVDGCFCWVCCRCVSGGCDLSVCEVVFCVCVFLCCVGGMFSGFVWCGWCGCLIMCLC